MSTRSLGQLTIDLVAKVGGFEQGMDKAARTADKRMREMQQKAKMFGIAAGASIGGAMAAGVAVFVRNSAEAEKQLAQLDAILKSTGNAAGYTRDQLVSMAREFQNKSTFGANEIIEAETRMLSYSGVVGENIPRAMQAVIDQSTRLGMSLSQSAETIGRALESPAKAAAALAQQGFGAAFTKEVRATIDALVKAGREADAQILILEILEESYGGAAEAARDTFGGALSALKHTINDVLTGESGSLDGLTQSINELIETLNSPEFRRGTSAIAKSFVDFTNDAANAIDPLMREMRGLGTLIEGMGLQAEATGIRLKALFTLDRSEFERSIELMERGKELMDQGIAGALGGHAPNPFRNVRSSSSSVDHGRVKPEGVDTSGLISPEIQKIADALNEQAKAYGKTREELSKLNRERDLGLAKTDAEREAITASYDALDRAIASGDASKAARSGADSLRSSYQSLMDSMKERIALMGTEGELVRMVYRTQEGDLKGLDDALKENLVTMAEQEERRSKHLDEVNEEINKIKEKTRAVKEEREAAEGLLRDLEFERSLMGMGNAERAAAIQLYGMSADAVKEYGKAIRQANEDIESQLEQTRFVDGLRGEFAGFFEDVMTGTKSVSDSFRDMLADIGRMIARAAAQKWVEQLFGMTGTTQTGAAGGGWMAALAGMFGGGRASGGAIQAGKVYEVNEQGIEMATVNGRDYMLAGGNGHVTPAHQIRGGGSGDVTVNVHNAPAGTEVRQSRGPDGGLQLDVMLKAIKGEIAGDIANGGMVAGAMKGRFGLREAI